MPDRYFLDTNIFVYTFDDTARKKRQHALELVKNAITTQRGVVSYQVVQEFFNVALRRFAQPMTKGDAEDYLATVFIPLLAVHSSPGLYEAALQLAGRGGLSWYDSLIVAAAIEGQCDVLYTEDLQHGRKFGSLQILNPFV